MLESSGPAHMDWFTPADIYCERMNAGFWAEPVNAISNVAFLLAAIFLLANRQQPARLLGTLIILIGIGSFLFHTFANRLTGFLDVFFIGVYLVTYAWLWPKWVRGSGRLAQSISVIMLLLSIALAMLSVATLEHIWPDLPPGSYLGAWFYLIGLATQCATDRQRAGFWLWTTAGLFLVSMTARQLDMPLCEDLGGTHWIWHAMNAVVLFTSARALVVGATQPGAPKTGVKG